MRGALSAAGAELGLAVLIYAVCVTRPNVPGVLMSLPGYHQRAVLNTLKQSRRTVSASGAATENVLYKPRSTLDDPSARYVLRPMKLSSVSPYTACRNALTGMVPLSNGL